MPNKTYELLRNEIESQVKQLPFVLKNKLQVHQSKLPDDTEFQRVGVVLSWSTESGLAGTTGQDDVVYPIICSLVKGSTGAWKDAMDWTGNFRQELRRKYMNRRAPTLDDDTIAPLMSRVQFGPIGASPGEVTLNEKWQSAWNESRLILLFAYRELRDI